MQHRGIVARQIRAGDVLAELSIVFGLFEAAGDVFERLVPQARQILLNGAVLNGTVGGTKNYETASGSIVSRKSIHRVLQHGMDRILGFACVGQGTNRGVSIRARVEVHSLSEQRFLISVSGVKARLLDAERLAKIRHRGRLVTKRPEKPHRFDKTLCPVELARPATAVTRAGTALICRPGGLYI